MTLQILTEMGTLFLPRLKALSVDDELFTQYQYDILASRCKLELSQSSLTVYLSCLDDLHTVINTLHENGNIFYLSDLIDTPLVEPAADSKIIQIPPRQILSTEVYEALEAHGEYLCDIAKRSEGLKILSRGVSMIEQEQAGE
jgi:hypothetical protein